MITEISRDGQPIKPLRSKEAFSTQCGVLVRDKIPISIQQWFKPATEDPEVSYVNDMRKNDLWTELKSNFTLPPEDNPENPVKEQLIKSFALKKMATYSGIGRKTSIGMSKKTRHQNSRANMRRSEMTRPHLWPKDIGKE